MTCRLRTKDESDRKRITEDWGSLTWLASAEISDSDLTVGRVVIKPGQSNPRHCHDNCEEVLYLLHGSLNCFPLMAAWTPEQAADNAAAADLELTPEDIAWLNLETDAP